MTNRNESSISIEADLFEESRKRIYICVYIYMYIRLVIFFSRTNQTTKEGRTNESWIIPRMNRQPRHCSIPDKLSLFFFFLFFSFCIIFIDDLQVIIPLGEGDQDGFTRSRVALYFINEL